MLTTILAVVILLSALVLLHEGGHFLAARLMGVTVEEFGIGFPPRLIHRKRGATVYSINLLPFGGFVRLKGEEGANRDPDSFTAQRPWRRAVIVVSGVALNALGAYMILVMIAAIGVRQEVPLGTMTTQFHQRRVEIVAVEPGSPAFKQSLYPGDIITSVNGQSTEDIEQAIDAIRSSATSPRITIERSGSSMTAIVDRTVLRDGKTMGIGAMLTQTAVVRYSVPQSFLVAAEQWWIMVQGTVGGIGQLLHTLFTTSKLPKDISGPIGIAVLIGKYSQQGLGSLALLASLISVNLAVLNTVPFPALDGGRLFMILIEAIRRKPVPLQFEIRFHQVGLLLLLALVLFVTIADIQRLVS